jgi:uncharacterized membrane protein YkvI
LLLPGLVLQSINIAGGYGTGRELVEFFLRFGPVGGLMAMIPTTILTSVSCMVVYELARLTKSYDYRSMLHHVLGRGWFLYEIAYFSAVIMILAVIGSATGVFLSETFGLPPVLGVAGLLITIGFLVLMGTKIIEGIMSFWSFVLYAVYITLFVWSIARFGPQIAANLRSVEIRSGWALSGIRFSVLLITLIPAMLFATTYIKTRRDAFIAGALSGPLVTIPGVLFLVATIGLYPNVLERPVPANYLLEALGSRTFQITFQLVLFGTLIETGTGLIHAINERLANAHAMRGRTMLDYMRLLTAAILLIGASLLSTFGIIAIIARGYGVMTWVFMAIWVIPLLTVGVAKIRSANGPPAPAASPSSG